MITFLTFDLLWYVASNLRKRCSFRIYYLLYQVILHKDRNSFILPFSMISLVFTEDNWYKYLDLFITEMSVDTWSLFPRKWLAPDLIISFEVKTLVQRVENGFVMKMIKAAQESQPLLLFFIVIMISLNLKLVNR